MTSTGAVNKKDESASGKVDFVFLAMRGSLVTATLNDGRRLEGILDRLDPQAKKVCLKMVSSWPTLSSTESQEHAFCDFTLGEMAALSVAAVNFAEVTGGGSACFATDIDITTAAGAGGAGEMRELARWEGGDSTELGLEDDAPPGSHHWNQFETNEKLFGVVTSFDESAYTTMIDKHSAQFRTRHAEAERLAKEIERGVGNTSNPHLAEERGAIFDDSQIDEEDRYGAVVRDKGEISGPPKARSPASYKDAAVAAVKAGQQKTSVVQMPSNTTSSRSPSALSPGGQEERSLSPPKPRKSIANLEQSVDPHTFAQAMEVVENNTGAIQRRLSQVAEADPNVANALQEQHRLEQFERQKKDATEQFKAFSEKLSSKMSTGDSSSTPGPASPSLSASLGKLNPNAADFVPITSAAPTPAPIPPMPFNPYAVPMAGYPQPYGGSPMGGIPFYNPYSMPPPSGGPYMMSPMGYPLAAPFYPMAPYQAEYQYRPPQPRMESRPPAANDGSNNVENPSKVK